MEMEAGTTTTIPGVVTPTANVGDGVALSMQARHALLSSTYEHVLGEGMRVLVKDVERAVARCTSRCNVVSSDGCGSSSSAVELRLQLRFHILVSLYSVSSLGGVYFKVQRGGRCASMCSS